MRMQTLQQLLKQQGWIMVYGTPEYHAHQRRLGPIPFQIAEGIDPDGYCIRPKYKPVMQTHETSRKGIKYYYEPIDAVKETLANCREVVAHQRDEIQNILKSNWLLWFTRPMGVNAKSHRIDLAQKLECLNSLMKTATNEEAMQSLIARSDLPSMDAMTPTLPVNIDDYVYTLWDGLFSTGKLTLQEHKVKKTHLDFTCYKKTLVAEWRVKCTFNFSFTFGRDDNVKDSRIPYSSSNVRLFTSREAAEAEVKNLTQGDCINFKSAKS
jgi:hypothetical protein